MRIVTWPFHCGGIIRLPLNSGGNMFVVGPLGNDVDELLAYRDRNALIDIHVENRLAASPARYTVWWLTKSPGSDCRWADSNLDPSPLGGGGRL
jgi:hypothetical protein